jgi:hypothetical protein
MPSVWRHRAPFLSACMPSVSGVSSVPSVSIRLTGHGGGRPTRRTRPACADGTSARRLRLVRVPGKPIWLVASRAVRDVCAVVCVCLIHIYVVPCACFDDAPHHTAAYLSLCPNSRRRLSQSAGFGKKRRSSRSRTRNISVNLG